MQPNKLRIIATVFLAYFFFFAVSQLSFRYHDRQAGMLCSTHSASPQIQLGFVFEKTLYAYRSFEDVHDCNAADDIILLRKKRAVLSAQKLIKKLSQLKNADLVAREVFFGPDVAIEKTAVADLITECDFLTSSSDLSPPVV